MSYEEILEKIRKAKALADSKKAGSHTDNTDASKSDKISRSKDSEASSHQYRAVVEDWSKPEDLAPDGKTFLDLFTSRWKCYSKWPNNVKELDNLHNNFKDISISSYFEIPTDPSVVLSEWGLPPNLRKNVYLDDERASHIMEVLGSKSNDNYVLVFRGTDSLKDFKTGNNPFSQRQNAYALKIFDVIRNNTISYMILL